MLRKTFNTLELKLKKQFKKHFDLLPFLIILKFKKKCEIILKVILDMLQINPS